MKRLLLGACPRVAPLGWPNDAKQDTVFRHVVEYRWVYVKPDGSGWTTGFDDSLVFPESKLDDVLEGFYASAGPYPFDFEVTVMPQPAKTKRVKKTTKTKKAKRVVKRRWRRPISDIGREQRRRDARNRERRKRRVRAKG